VFLAPLSVKKTLDAFLTVLLKEDLNASSILLTWLDLHLTTTFAVTLKNLAATNTTTNLTVQLDSVLAFQTATNLNLVV